MFKKGLIIFCLMIIGLLSSMASFAQDTQDRFLFEHEKIDLMVGIYKEIEMPDLPDQARFKIPDRSFAQVVDISWDNDKKILRLKPKKQGSVLLTFLDVKDDKVIKQIRIFVNKNDIDRIAKEIKTLLGSIEGIEIKVLNNKIIVDGQIILPSDMNRIVSVITQYPKEIVSTLVRLSPLAMTKIANLIERDINNPEISVRVVNSFFILEGVARDLDERDEALRIAQAYVPREISEFAEAPIPGSTLLKKKIRPDGDYVLDRVINHLRIQPDPPSRPPKVIQIIVQFVELKKSYQRGFSFSWIPKIGDGTEYRYERTTQGASTTVGSIAAVISNLLPKLDWAREHGHARILKSLSMIVEDGNPGFFNAVQEIPVVVSGIAGPSTMPPREVGLKLSVTPEVTGPRSDIISMKVEFESGELLENTENGPLTSKNTVNTKVTVRSGQSAALGGLVTGRSGTDYNRMPTNDSGGDPLFKLLASKAFNRGQSQFVMFITPFIKSSASEGSDTVKKKFRIDK